jgi:RNA polymerase sigma-70 factor (ECF subfamily)
MEAREWNERLTWRYREPLLRFFRRRVKRQPDAEDLVQDVMVRLVNAPPQQQSSPIDSYIFTVARNLLRDRARREQVRARHDASDLSSDDSVQDVASEDASLERVLMGQEQLAHVAAALDELGERTRAIFILCRIEGMKHEEIARDLGITVSAVEKHVSKALRHIAQRLTHE